MKRIKQIFSSLFAVMILLGGCVGMFGCANSSEKTNNSEKIGTFYFLREAYNEGILTKDDVIKIASYYKWETSIEKQDELSLNLLNENAQTVIRNAYKTIILEQPQLSDEYINLYAYYGTYNGAVAIGITDTYCAYDLIIIEEYEVAGVIFFNYAERDIRIWVK